MKGVTDEGSDPATMFFSWWWSNLWKVCPTNTTTVLPNLVPFLSSWNTTSPTVASTANPIFHALESGSSSSIMSTTTTATCVGLLVLLSLTTMVNSSQSLRMARILLQQFIQVLIAFQRWTRFSSPFRSDQQKEHEHAPLFRKNEHNNHNVISIQRHFYKSTRLFEQSLDIYQPSISLSSSSSSSSSSSQVQGRDATVSPPIVLLVVGSGWAGHHAMIYAGTSWWNASGPKTLAQLGCTCICIRHKGGFPHFSIRHVTSVMMILAAMMYAKTRSWHYTLATALILGLYFGILRWLAHGAATTLDEMVDDVADALQWVHGHDLRHHDDHPRRPILFGGYSSGGHVAATLLSRPDVFARRRIPPPQEWMDGVLYLSAVLGVRPSTCQPSNHHLPTFLADFIIHSIFPTETEANQPAKHVLSSPVDDLEQHTIDPPHIPHLLIGCHQEVFGLNWLDIFFQSQRYHDLLQSQYDIPSRYVAIPSNHWNILASRHLKYALEQHLFGWLIQPSQIVQADKPQKQRFYHYQQQQEQHKEQPNEHGNGITTSSLSSSSSSSSSFNNSSITPSSSSSDNNNRMKENRTMVPTTWTNQWFSW